MLVVARFSIPEVEAESFDRDARLVLAAFAARVGYLGGRLGRAADDPTAWVLTMEWDGVGAYRRALSAYDVRMAATALLGRAHREPSAYELLYADGPGVAAGGPSRRAADADSVAVGRAAGPGNPPAPADPPR